MHTVFNQTARQPDYCQIHMGIQYYLCVWKLVYNEAVITSFVKVLYGVFHRIL